MTDKLQLAKVISGLVGICVLLEGTVALCALKWGVQEWQTVNTLTGDLHTLAVALVGGLLALARPGNGGTA